MAFVITNACREGLGDGTVNTARMLDSLGRADTLPDVSRQQRVEDSEAELARAKQQSAEEQTIQRGIGSSFTRMHRSADRQRARQEIPADQQKVLVDATLVEHQSWLKTPAAQIPENSFSCRILALHPPSTEATAWFDKGLSLPEGKDQDLAYIKAAELGHWRAAARLASSALDNEDWESAQPAIAWLLKKRIPSGYAKLAELIASRASYDGATMGESVTHLVTSLRWRAAQLGDPVAQSLMSRHFEREGKDQVARDFLACARWQKPKCAPQNQFAAATWTLVGYPARNGPARARQNNTRTGT